MQHPASLLHGTFSLISPCPSAVELDFNHNQVPHSVAHRMKRSRFFLPLQQRWSRFFWTTCRTGVSIMPSKRTGQSEDASGRQDRPSPSVEAKRDPNMQICMGWKLVELPSERWTVMPRSSCRGLVQWKARQSSTVFRMERSAWVSEVDHFGPCGAWKTLGVALRDIARLNHARGD